MSVAFTRENIRKFGIPDISFEAEVYVDIIDWKDGSALEPPLTRSLSEEEQWNLQTISSVTISHI